MAVPVACMVRTRSWSLHQSRCGVMQGPNGDAPLAEVLSEAVSCQRSGNSIPVIPICISVCSTAKLQALVAIQMDGLALPPTLMTTAVAGIVGAGLTPSTVGDMVAALKSSMDTTTAQLESRAEARSMPRLHSQAFEEVVEVEKVMPTHVDGYAVAGLVFERQLIMDPNRYI